MPDYFEKLEAHILQEFAEGVAARGESMTALARWEDEHLLEALKDRYQQFKKAPRKFPSIPRRAREPLLGARFLEFAGGAFTFGGMSSPKYRLRRATLDDLRQLAALWGTMNFAVDELARRITDFHLAESAEGVLLGAAGLQVAERQGLVHSEGFTDFALADTLRPLLWERIQAVALNQGLLRLWTREQAPFWSHCGLVKADAEALDELPAAWRGLPPAWRTLKLRGDLDAIVSADEEFARFAASEKQQTARLLRRGKILKSIAAFLAFLFLALILGATVYLLWRNAQPHR